MVDSATGTYTERVRRAWFWLTAANLTRKAGISRHASWLTPGSAFLLLISAAMVNRKAPDRTICLLHIWMCWPPCVTCERAEQRRFRWSAQALVAELLSMPQLRPHQARLIVSSYWRDTEMVRLKKLKDANCLSWLETMQTATDHDCQRFANNLRKLPSRKNWCYWMAMPMLSFYSIRIKESG